MNSVYNNWQKSIKVVTIALFFNASFVLPKLPDVSIENKIAAVCAKSSQQAAGNSLKASLMQNLKVPNAGTVAATFESCNFS